MRRRILPILAVVGLLLIGVGAPAQAGPALPSAAHPRGDTYQEWMQLVGQFFLGDASNPLIAGLEGECGQLIDGVFFLVAPIDVGLEFQCEIPVGTPIVLSHGGFFATEGIEGDTDEELLAAAEAGYSYTSNSVIIDGMAIPLRTVNAGVFDVISEQGGFYDAVLGVGTGPVRTALVGNLVFLHPLAPGDHIIEVEVTLTGGGEFSATYHLHVS